MVTVADFTDLVPQITTQSVIDNLQSIIDEFEIPFLIDLLGDALAVDVEDNPEVYDELINGQEFGKFKGVKQIVISYIFFEWRKSTYCEQTASGTVTPKSENADNQSPNIALANIWNNMRKSWFTMIAYLELNPIEIYDGENPYDYMSWL